MYDAMRFIGITKDATTAGPGKRLEFFTKGCIRGVISPCNGCFNQLTWTFEGQYRELNSEEIIAICMRDAWNRQVTFCGGEPILQGRVISRITQNLKQLDPTFHFIMYTSYKLDMLIKYGLQFTWTPKYGKKMLEHLQDYSSAVLSQTVDCDSEELTYCKFMILSPEEIKELMKYIDIIVDGDYQQDKRLTTSKHMHDGWFIGSSNQRVINGPLTIKSGAFHYIQADKYNYMRSEEKHCEACGHSFDSDEEFCSNICSVRYFDRIKENKWGEYKT